MLTNDQIEAAWKEVKLSPWPLHSVELNRSVRHRFAREIEKAALREAARICDDEVCADRAGRRIRKMGEGE